MNKRSYYWPLLLLLAACNSSEPAPSEPVPSKSGTVVEGWPRATPEIETQVEILTSGEVIARGKQYVNSRDARAAAYIRKYDALGAELKLPTVGDQLYACGFMSVDAQQRLLTVFTAFDKSTYMTVCRHLTSDGSDDASFGDSGCRKFTGLPLDHAVGVRSLASGAVLAATSSVLLQATPSGELDLNFGVQGIYLVEPSFGLSSFAAQSDGRILVALSKNTAQGTPRKLIRLTSSGVLDPSFASAGTLLDVGGTIYMSADNAFFVLDSDKRSLSRYLAQGTPDVSFGTNGKVDLAATAQTDVSELQSTAIAVDAEGRVYFAVNTNPGTADSTSYRALIARLRTDGTLDTDFGIHTEIEHHFLTLDAISIGADGKILISGIWTDENRHVNWGLALLWP
ncbi:hypothetical protein JGU66_33245 [Myxococcaceae bacterium JPH2]|nr:hypothetical protein [Myxococcaceae bacterium JPH2]